MAMNIPATTDADKAYAMKAAEFRSLPSGPEGMARLRQATNGPFGALALIEIDKRTRAELLNAVQKQAVNQQQGTMLQQTLQREAQARMMNQLANDERMGLNNLVAQAEQGAIDFGQPMGGAAPAPAAAIGESQGAMPMGAGGGVVAFEKGGGVRYDDGSLGYIWGGVIPAIGAGVRTAAPYVGRAVGRGIAAFKNRDIGLGTASLLATPFGFLGGGDKETPVDRDTVLKDTDYPDETRRGTARDVAEGRKAPNRFDSLGLEAQEERLRKAEEGKGAGIAALAAPQRETDVRKILEEENKLLKEMGLGEYGSKVKESIEKRRGEAGERAEKRLASEPFLAAAEAAGGGGKRMSGLQALAAAVGAGGKAAAGLTRERDAALDKITEGEEKLLLAQDLYQRGRVGDAQKIGREAQQNIFDNQVKLRTLDLTEKKINAALEAARAKGGRLPQTVIAALEKERAVIQDALASKQITPQEAQRRMAELQNRINSYIMLGGGLQVGTRDTDED